MYDPLLDNTIPADQRAPTSLWAEDQAQPSYPQLTQDINIDVAIIGGGFTGLSAAFHLVEQYGVNVALFEANQPGWGCSGRNGGFVLPGTGRLSVAQMHKRWGEETTAGIYAENLASVDTVKAFIDAGIVCDVQAGGYLKLAHTQRKTEQLHQQARVFSDTYNDKIIPLSQAQVAAEYIASTEQYGGIYHPNAFGVNPWKLAHGLAKRAAVSGARIFGNTPVLNTEFSNGKHLIYTPNGNVEANQLILATNAYGPNKLHASLYNRNFPVMSSILVTQPLTKEQLDKLQVRDGLMVMDTRSLKYYYRILADGRLLFGGRGAIAGRNADSVKSKQNLLNGLKMTFPELGNVKIGQFWSGWVNISMDDYPRIYHDKATATSYSAGYCGAGLAFSIQAGKRLAQQLYEPETLPKLPYFQTPLKKYPVAPMRRTVLHTLYWWEGLKRVVGLD
ncbi:FAD-dependent oxidoreductase [Alteromonas sp. ASW11-36]|uniref:FAD-dependent oxidoreductase n=1 Tax=Alteromonas arenosi TaxID=3055817 RepID=A0ABT7SVN3_9ALTE|nr:FAD-dependent oxidoreductase [Alteromonas sp. ASW11-36]MDM7860258.1 FAD-dependent oxidoreductase [Alteromonas sp. ASW11-36]